MQADGLLSTLKHLRLYGMSQALHELVEQDSPACRDALPLIETLLKAEVAEREVRSIHYQLKAARFPHYRDLSNFDFGQSAVDEGGIERGEPKVHGLEAEEHPEARILEAALHPLCQVGEHLVLDHSPQLSRLGKVERRGVVPADKVRDRLIVEVLQLL